jgi:hypothetical protein
MGWRQLSQIEKLARRPTPIDTAIRRSTDNNDIR